MAERRRGDDFVTHAELRRALQPLFDLKVRLDPPLRFYELMQPLGIERLLPELLKDENVRQAVRSVSSMRWRRTYRWALAVGAIASIALIGSFLLNVYFLFTGHKS